MVVQVDVLLVVSQVGFCVAYLLFIADNIECVQSICICNPSDTGCFLELLLRCNCISDAYWLPLIACVHAELSHMGQWTPTLQS